METRKKKIWTVVAVGALTAAVAGGGALSTLYTSVSGNEFRAEVPDAAVAPEGGLLQISGAAIDHTFDATTFNEAVRASWVLENRGALATEFDGQFATLAGIDADLAAALVVQYGEVDAGGTVVRWVDGGTVAAPRSFATATGIDSIDGGDSIPVEVRVVLEDPTLIASADPDEIGETLRVVADFTVSYLDPTL